MTAFGAENVFSRTVFAGTFPWTARFELGLALAHKIYICWFCICQ